MVDREIRVNDLAVFPRAGLLLFFLMLIHAGAMVRVWVRSLHSRELQLIQGHAAPQYPHIGGDHYPRMAPLHWQLARSSRGIVGDITVGEPTVIVCLLGFAAIVK